MEKELIFKAKQAKTPEELIAIAKENGMEMTEERAKTYFEQLNPTTGELSDDEMDGVMKALQDIYWECKAENREKYTLKKLKESNE